MRKAFLAAMAIVAGATPALAAESTVNSYTPAQEDQAKARVVKAGYQPDKLAMVQDGNFFFAATKGGQTYQATVTKAGEVFVSTPLPSEDASKPPAG